MQKKQDRPFLFLRPSFRSWQTLHVLTLLLSHQNMGMRPQLRAHPHADLPLPCCP